VRLLFCALVLWASPCAAEGFGLRARFDLDPLHAMAPEQPSGHAIAIRVEGLTAPAVRLLDRTRRAGDALVRVPGSEVWELWTTSDRFVEWLSEYQALARLELGRSRPATLWRSLAVCVVSSGQTGPLMAESSIRVLSRIDDGGRRVVQGGVRRWTRPVEVEKARSERDEYGIQRIQSAMLKVTAVLEATRVDPTRRDRVADGVRGGVRVKRHLELGGGYRRLPAEIKGGTRQGDVTWSSVVFMRAGVHLEGRPDARLAIPVSIDVGRGSSIMFHLRLHTGLRVRVQEGLYFGLNVLDPTYTQYADNSDAPVESEWDMRSSAEMTAEF